MTFPIELAIGQGKINLHLIFETLGFLIGFRYYTFLKSKTIDPINDSNRLWIVIGATLGALIFSRLVGCLENPIELMKSTNKLLFIYANKTIVGGLLGGLIGVEITKLLINEKSSSGDLFTRPIILAMIIGRIGCFTNGIYESTYGFETESIFGMDLGDGKLRHPLILYEIFLLVLMFVILKITENKINFKNGFRFQFFLIFYLCLRLVFDFMKPTYRIVFGLSTIQITCLLGLVYYYKTIFYIFINPKKLLNE